MMTNVDIQTITNRARSAAAEIASLPETQVCEALLLLAGELWEQRDSILAANKIDIEAAQKTSLHPALIDRLTLNENKLQTIAADLRRVAGLPDPVGEIIEAETLPNGLQVRKQRVPLGVLAVIYESRPNVTIDICGLALKSHNAVILRGGSETLASNRALVKVIHTALKQTGLSQDAVQFIDNPDRNLVLELLKMDKDIDLVIPRGSNTLQDFCRQNSRIPVVYGGIGICHLFVDESADHKASLPVIRNAKIQAPSVCNALDTLLVHEKIATAFLPEVVRTLSQDGVTFHCDEKSYAILAGQPNVVLAGKDDFDTEWLSLALSIKLVSGLEESIQHISQHSTHHSDGILTQNFENAAIFIQKVDSAAVYVNASTRFTDGSQLGMGAEVAISTQRLHARGPMGLRELTTYKWVIEGDYHYRN